MKYLSLFSGIGGFEYAIHQVFPEAECVGYSEIDKYAIQIYQKNFPNHTNLGDINEIDISRLPMFDLLIGGSPCQDLSIAKSGRQGLEGAKSGLFYKYLEILREREPRWFILENVASMKAEERDKITAELGVQPIMINAALVSAQNRKRYYWTNIPGILQPSDRGILLKHILEEEVDEKYNVNISEKYGFKGLKDITGKAGALTASSYKGYGNDGVTTIRVGQIGKGGQGDRIYSPEGKSVNLSANGGGRGAKTGLYCVAQRGRYKEDGTTEQKLEARDDGKTNTLTTVQKDNMVAIIQRGRGFNKGGVHTDKSPTLSANAWQENNMLQQYGVIRKLTPIECERLQRFPDNWTEGISNTQRYKCLGNAVNTEVIKHILSFLNQN